MQRAATPRPQAEARLSLVHTAQSDRGSGDQKSNYTSTACGKTVAASSAPPTTFLGTHNVSGDAAVNRMDGGSPLPKGEFYRRKRSLL